MKKIKLTQGKFTIVDDSDFEYLNQWKWYLDKKYAKRTIYPRKWEYLHRKLLNAPRGTEIDHINHDTLDNRKSNLRICYKSNNQHNALIRSDNKTGYKGVYFDSNWKKFRASVCINNKIIHIRNGKDCGFDTAKEAAQARDRIALEYHKDFAYLNFPFDNQAQLAKVGI